MNQSDKLQKINKKSEKINQLKNAHKVQNLNYSKLSYP
jgi:hypothetical protein